MPIRTAVIDDDAVIRQLLQIMLETAPALSSWAAMQTLKVR